MQFPFSQKISDLAPPLEKLTLHNTTPPPKSKFSDPPQLPPFLGKDLCHVSAQVVHKW